MSLNAEMTSRALNFTELATNGGHANGTTPQDAELEYTMYFTYTYWSIYAVGLLGNLFALVIWARSGLRNSPVTYFQAICVADSLVLVLHPLETLPDFVHVSGLCQLVHVLFLAVQVFAIFLVLGLTVERYIELCHPLKADHLISYKRTVRCILLLACLSVLFSLCEAYIWHVPGQAPDHAHHAQVLAVAPRHCQMRQSISQNFMWAYAILVLTLLFLCPLLLIILFNVLVARRIRHRRKNSLAYSVSMVPDKHNMNLSVTFVSLYLAVCEIVYAVVHSSQYFVSDQQRSGGSDLAATIAAASSAAATATTGTPQVGGDKSGMPLTGRWHSAYIDSLPLYIADVLALTSYAVDVTIFTLCSRTFRRNVCRHFRRHRRRKSLCRGCRAPSSQEASEQRLPEQESLESPEQESPEQESPEELFSEQQQLSEQQLPV